MPIVAVGCSHKSAPLALLESLSITSNELSAVFARLKSAAYEALILSTCNRTEIYALVEQSRSGAADLLESFAERAHASATSLRRHMYVHTDADAVRHALCVASGLDSVVLGEDQIQAQLRRALAEARHAQAVGPVLDRLGAAALACGKRVRTFTGIGRHSVSLESLAVRAAADRLSGLEGREVVLIGTGDAARLIATHLRAVSDAHITVVSRSLHKAAEFARPVDAQAARIDDIAEVLTRADVVFCCTSAPHAILAAEHLRARDSARPGEALVCVDLGMPRDVDLSVWHVAGVTVISLEELGALAEAHWEERRQHVPAAEAIVDAEVARFLEWRTARGRAATIARLQAHAQSIADSELGIAQARLATLSSRDRDIVADMARRIVRKLMHAPSTTLQQHPAAESISFALECAFGLSAAPTGDDQLADHAAAPDASRPAEAS